MVLHRLFPSWEQIKVFRNPLTEGERTLVEFLDSNLPPEWEIYVQPYLNNDRPDLVLLHPKIGVQIIEVKDWSTGLYQASQVKIRLPQNGEWRTIRKFEVRDKSGKWQEIDSPLNQVERYRTNLLNLYFPKLGEEIDKNSKKLSILKISIYMHRLNTKEAKELIAPPDQCSVFGFDALTSNDIAKVVPDIGRQESFFMTEEIANELRNWLIPPFHAIEQGTDIQLTNQQLKYSKPTLGKRQVLHGVPGSGKTLVLAQRAARIASEGKTVLILSFNITLWHYIRDQINRAKYAFDWSNIEIRHFHAFCWNYFSENDIPKEKGISFGDDYYKRVVPGNVIKYMREGKNHRKRIYDAILIDEGQDYEELWFNALELFLSPQGQILFVVDERQNIYGRELQWITSYMEVLPQLKQSFRLPSIAVDQANHFANLFLNGIETEPIQFAIPFEQRNPHLIWRNIADFKEAKLKIHKAVDWLRRKQKVHPVDIVILVPNHYEGLRLVESFERQYIGVNHVFEADDGDKRHKNAFWMGDSRLKMSTIHSFKGWELVNVILLTPDEEQETNEALDNSIYTALTRTRENLIVFNRMSRYVEFGSSWPQTWD